MKKLAVLLFAFVMVSGCARADEASLQDVVDGVAGPERYVRAIVTDARTAEREVLVELSGGGVTVWATGFAERPGRGAEVWTAFLGAPVTHDLVGLTYPTAGVLDAPAVGITDMGLVGVILALLTLLALTVSGGAAGVLRMRPARRCSSCGEAGQQAWTTCPTCGQAMVSPAAEPKPVTATIFSKRQDAAQPDTAKPAIDAVDAADAADTSRKTRIFQRNQS